MSRDWTEFGLRGLPSMSGRTQMTAVPPLLQPLVDAIQASLAQPVRGITTDGNVVSGLFQLHATGVSTAPIVEAAERLLGTLDEKERAKVSFDLDAIERRQWFNIHPNVFRHGVMLEDLATGQRDVALELLRATLSVRGFQQSRDIMRLNGLLAEVTGSADEFGEWPYFVSIFGTPSTTEPWAWQIDGHHLNLNCFVIGDHMTLSPTFMGSEPCHVQHGPLAGTRVFEAEQRAGLALRRSLDAGQAARAVLYDSILPGALPDDLNNFVDGRMKAGAFKDNGVIPYAGVRGGDLEAGQRSLLRDLIDSYIGWARDDMANVTMLDIERHLHDTWFCWMGTDTDDGPFYYRVHGPVVLIEFDHHPGVVFDNLEPSHHHIHTVVRTPNGGDYGTDWLRQHHARFDHRSGHHVPR